MAALASPSSASEVGFRSLPSHPRKHLETTSCSDLMMSTTIGSSKGFKVPEQQPDALVQRLREEQERCSANLSFLKDRMLTLEEQMHIASAKVELSLAIADAPRVPIILAAEPREARGMPRLPGAADALRPRGADSSPVAAAHGEAVAASSSPLSATDAEEVAALRRDVDALRVIQTDSVSRLEAALDAARTGIAKLARQVHYDREERTKAMNNIRDLADDVGKKVVNPTFEKAHRALEKSIGTSLKQAIVRIQTDVESRFHLLAAEMRGQAFVQSGLPGGGRATPAAPSCAASAGPPATLADWLPENADGDIKATTSMLMQLRVFDHIPCSSGTPEQQIARPTTRFVYKVVIAIKHNTGYPAGILEDWPGPPEAKFDFLTKIWDNIALTLGLQSVDFNAKDVLHCTNRQRTRRLLQLLAIAAMKESGSESKVQAPVSQENGSDSKLQAPVLQTSVSAGRLPLTRLTELARDEGDMSPNRAPSHATSVCWH